MMQEMFLSSIISDVSREYYPIAFFSSPFHIFIKLILHQIQWRPNLSGNRHFLRIQLEVCRLANMSVAASLASQNALGVACKGI